MNAPGTSRARGFTLIELLVVIAIISILASMLMPTYSRAREAARKTVCVNQLKQVGTAIDMYAQDNDGCYPVAWTFWAQQASLPAYPNLNTTLYSYIRNSQIWWCPSWSGRYGVNTWGWISNPQWGGCYDFITPNNGGQEVIGVPGNGPNGMSAASSWSDSALQDTSSYPLVWCGGYSDPPAMQAHSGTTDSAFAAGGLGGTNILYADYHAKWTPLDKGKWQTIYQTRR